jgi:hypothetical protein
LALNQLKISRFIAITGNPVNPASYALYGKLVLFYLTMSVLPNHGNFGICRGAGTGQDEPSLLPDHSLPARGFLRRGCADRMLALVSAIRLKTGLPVIAPYTPHFWLGQRIRTDTARM